MAGMVINSGSSGGPVTTTTKAKARSDSANKNPPQGVPNYGTGVDNYGNTTTRAKTPQEIANEQGQANVYDTTAGTAQTNAQTPYNYDANVRSDFFGTTGAGQNQVTQNNYEAQALEALRQQGNKSAASSQAQAEKDLLAERDKFNKLAEERRLGYINQLGGAIQPNVSEGGAADSTAARDAAFAREKDRIGQMGRGAVNSLSNLMSERGTMGGGYEQKGMTDIVSGTQGQLGDVAREQTIQDLSRADNVADRNYQGRVVQRGQNIPYRQSLLGLMSAGGIY